jgi:hypothetical protein
VKNEFLEGIRKQMRSKESTIFNSVNQQTPKGTREKENNKQSSH